MYCICLSLSLETLRCVVDLLEFEFRDSQMCSGFA